MLRTAATHQLQQHALLQALARAPARLRQQARVVAHAVEHVERGGGIDRLRVVLDAATLGRVTDVDAEHAARLPSTRSAATAQPEHHMPATEK